MQRLWTGVMLVTFGCVLAFGGSAAEASHAKANSKKHKVVYHLFEGGKEKASQLLTNMQNHVETVGWPNMEALELVVHGPALRTFLKKDFDPEIKNKLETLLTGGMKIDACQITMRRQQISVDELIEGLTAVPSGVVRVMELQEAGYAYIKP